MKILRMSALVAATGGALTACGGGETKSLNGLQEYTSIAEMTDDLASGGLECDRTEPRETSRYSAESASCWIGKKEYVLGIHLSDRDRDAQVAAIELSGELLGEHGIVAGANWTVNCDNPDDCRAVKQALGGKTSASG